MKGVGGRCPCYVRWAISNSFEGMKRGKGDWWRAGRKMIEYIYGTWLDACRIEGEGREVAGCIR